MHSRVNILHRSSGCEDSSHPRLLGANHHITPQCLIRWFIQKEVHCSLNTTNFHLHLQLGTGNLANNLDKSTTVAQADLSALNRGNKSELLKALRVNVTSSPNLGNKLVSRLNRGSESSLELLDVGWVRATELLEDAVSSEVPRRETVHDSTAEAHSLSWLWGGVKWVVVTVQAVQESGLWEGLVGDNSIWLLVLWWWVVDRGWALWSTPVTLADEESRADGAGIDLPGLGINQLLLGVDNGTGLALVVDADNLVAELELASRRGWWEWLQELDRALAVKDTAGVELWNIWDRDGTLDLVEVDNLLGGGLEC